MPDRRSPLQLDVDEAADEEQAVTAAEWARLTGYEPRTRQYEAPSA